MSEPKFDPHTSRDLSQLRKYFKGLGFEDPEIDGFIGNWTRTDPQSMKEVRSGIEWERANRLASPISTLAIGISSLSESNNS